MHQRRCLAASIIAAVENLRDEEGITDLDFRIAMQENRPLTEADDYLTTGLMTCTCRIDRLTGKPADVFVPPEDVVNLLEWEELRRLQVERGE